ncbi:MAG: hypothetical protein PHF31_03600 [Methylobacter sp.]|nr:hypothetical protein [Methylobacter sp.]
MNKIGDTLIHVGANEELVRVFAANSVEFIIIGGLAVAWYCDDRQADDMDLLVNPTTENSARISRALDGLHMNSYTSDSFTKPGLQVPLKRLYYAELLTPQKDGPTYFEVAKDAVDAKLFNIPVRLASVASLIRLKELAVASAETQKDKHIRDIERLKKHAV